MEEKLRNLSQNIANNTGPREADEPEKDREDEHFSDENIPNTEEDIEHIDVVDSTDVPEDEEDLHEEVSDYTPEPADDFGGPEEETIDEGPTVEDAPVEETSINDELIKEHDDIDNERHDEDIVEPEDKPEETPEADLEDEEPLEEPEAEEPQEEEPQKEDSTTEEHEEEHHEDSEPAKAVILSMEEDEDKPQESPTRMKKYSPEVEAALSRLNSEEASVDLSEPLSTEPHKKHHGGQIFLFILFVLALAAICICILVEQKIIDNPFPNIFNKQESSTTQPTEEPEPEPEPEPEIEEPEEDPEEAAKYLKIEEWGIKVVKPENIGKYWYAISTDNSNEARLFGLESSDTTSEAEANSVISLIRSTESTLQYTESLTVLPTANFNDYYYYLVLTSGDPEDRVTQLFQDGLIGNNNAIAEI